MKLRRCCCVSFVALISLTLLLLVVVLDNMTIFNFRDPQVSVSNIKMKRFSANPALSILLSIYCTAIVRVRNPNFYTLKYRNSSMLLTYHSDRVGVVELGAGVIPSRKTVEFPVVITLEAVRLVLYALRDIFKSGVARFNVDAMVSGWVELQPLWEKYWHATAISDCDVEVFIANQTVKQVQCTHKFNLQAAAVLRSFHGVLGF